MKFKVVIPFLLIAAISFSSFMNETEKIVEITTSYGVIKVKLYNETPLHRDNFIKLVNDGFYDGTLFHRVMNQFMIQGGDPNSIGAAPEVKLGNGGPGYTIPAEFNSKFIHKKGVLVAARQPDNVNPEKRSSGSQFYLVQGRKYSATDMARFQQRNMNIEKQKLMNAFFQKPENKAYLDRLTVIKQDQNQEAMNELTREIEPIIKMEYDKNPTAYTPEQLKTYEDIGGTPHLDGGYTIFGEVIQGLEIIDEIAAVATLQGDRPITDIKVTMKVLN
ncbi:MAG: peptidylprolyl isomerase [Flavobacteriales bacterium]|nr:peptidylprolyl isomerase [Flavobacteriales bacterium]